MTTRRLLTVGLALLCVGVLSITGLPRAAAVTTFTVQRDVVYNSHGMRLDVYQPTGATRRPIVVFVHGGGWIDNTKDWSIEYAVYFAQHNVTAITFNYRLAPRYRFPAAFNDTRDAVAWAKDNAASIGGDPDKVVIAGYSSGATMAALVGLHPSVHVRGVIGTSGAYDLEHDYATNPAVRSTLDLYMGSTPLGYSSPIKLVSPDDPPVLLQHGLHDVYTAAAETALMAKELDRQHAPNVVRYYPAGHELLTRLSDQYPQAMIDMLSFTLAVTG